MSASTKILTRCPWAVNDPILLEYHDKEWGVPVHDDRKHFEFLILEGAQAGLSWLTVLRKREGYRKAFAKFDPVKVSRFGEKEIAKLLTFDGIIRNNQKIRAAVNNASRFLEVQGEFGSFDNYLWCWFGDKPKVNRIRTLKDYKPTSKESDAISADMKKRGFKFCGSTIIYAHLQACGLVNDHTMACFRKKST